MHIGRNSLWRPPVAAVLAVAGVVALIAPQSAGGQGSAIVERFTPDSGGFTVSASAPPVAHPGGEFGFAVAGNRLLCTFELATGEYVRAVDLGLETFAALESDAAAATPLTLSSNGRVLALVAAGTARFYDVTNDGVVSARSDLGEALPVIVRLTDDGALAVVALGGTAPRIATVDTDTGEVLDAFGLGALEVPIEVRYAADRRAIEVLTSERLVFLRHKTNGNLSQTGEYVRGGFSGDAYSQFTTLGKRGRVAFTVDSGGAALVGLSLKGKQTARAPAPLPDRYSSPVAATPDGSTIGVARVSASTGLPTSIAFFEGDGRGLAKGDPKLLPLGDGLGEIGRLEFDPTGAVAVASFPQSSTLLLIDVETRRELDRTTAIGSADGFSFTSDGKRLLVSGSPNVGPLVPMGPGGVTVLPIIRREFDDPGAVRFERLPGVLVRPGDRAVSFANRFYAVVASDAADALFSFNVSAGSLLDRVELGPSMGLVAVAPDRRTLVVSAGGGIGVFEVDDDGRISQVGSSTPGAEPPSVAPCIVFHPSEQLAFVTADDAVWRVNLVTGFSTRFAIGGAGSRLTNPAIGSNGTRFYALEGTDTIVRCALGEGGGVTVIDRMELQATLDPVAPRVAYDGDATRVWMMNRMRVLQQSLLTGEVEDLSSNVATGRGVVFVRDRLLAVLPEGGGPIAYVEVADGGLRLDSAVDVGGDPFGVFGGGSLSIDAATERMFLPVGTRVLSVTGGGVVVDIDGDSIATHVSFVTPLPQLAYPDLARFPGSVVVARGF
ncbi:MAG: hypothetical protein IPF53_10540 [Blastocatellia bacterium]|nr:hypothetical protein [Blastocatellia bacterium]